MTEKTDYLFYEGSGVVMSSQPMKMADACVIATRNYIFLVPVQTVGHFGIVSTWKNHQYFEGVTVVQGVKNVIAGSKSTAELEKAFIALLEDDEKYVHKLDEKSAFKFRGIFGKHTLRMSSGGANWTSVSPKGKGTSKEFRAYYGQ